MNQWPTTTTDLRELINGAVEIEARLLAAIECSLRILALFTVQVKHPKDLLDGIDLVAGNNAVGFGQRAHDRERCVE